MYPLPSDDIPSQFERYMNRNAGFKDAVENELGDQNPDGYHCFAHMLQVWIMAGVLSCMEGLSEHDQDHLAVAAILHDAGHHAVPDSVLDENGQSKNIVAALGWCDYFEGHYPSYDWVMIRELIRCTQWPHQDVVDNSPFPRHLFKVLRDADLLSSLNVPSLSILLDGLPNELRRHLGTELPKGASQLTEHIKFFQSFKPNTTSGEVYFDKAKKIAYPMWLGHLHHRDGGSFEDYENVLVKYTTI